MHCSPVGLIAYLIDQRTRASCTDALHQLPDEVDVLQVNPVRALGMAVLAGCWNDTPRPTTDCRADRSLKDCPVSLRMKYATSSQSCVMVKASNREQINEPTCAYLREQSCGAS
jgi:hypothetical protein